MLYPLDSKGAAGGHGRLDISVIADEMIRVTYPSVDLWKCDDSVMCKFEADCSQRVRDEDGDGCCASRMQDRQSSVHACDFENKSQDDVNGKALVVDTRSNDSIQYDADAVGVEACQSSAASSRTRERTRFAHKSCLRDNEHDTRPLLDTQSDYVVFLSDVPLVAQL